MLFQNLIQGKYLYVLSSQLNFRYASYNVRFEKDGMNKSEIVLIQFTPDGDNLTQAQKGAKIQYSSTLSHLAGKFNPNKNRW